MCRKGSLENLGLKKENKGSKVVLLRQLGAKAKGQFRELGEKAAGQINASWRFMGIGALRTLWPGDAFLGPAGELRMGSIQQRSRRAQGSMATADSNWR